MVGKVYQCGDWDSLIELNCWKGQTSINQFKGLHPNLRGGFGGKGGDYLGPVLRLLGKGWKEGLGIPG